jgi:hypothetical protein
MAARILEPLEFVFLWWADEKYGALLSRGYYRLLDRVHFAHRSAKTWGEYIELLGSDAGYLDDFMQCDEVQPQESDLLEDIHNDVWVLSDIEFPITQCVQESFEFYGQNFPAFDDALTITTEYGMPLRLYPKARYLEIKAHLWDLGHQISEQRSEIPMHIYPY